METRFLVVQYDDRPLNKDMTALTKINKDYCEKHGYEYLFQTSSVHIICPFWKKVFILHDLLKTNKYKGILWLDSDAVIHTDKIRLEDLMEAGKSFYGAPDNKVWNSPFNAGVFFVLTNHAGMKIITEWISYYNRDDWYKNEEGIWCSSGEWADETYEQGSFIKFIQDKYKEDIKIFPWHFMQCFYTDIHEFEGRKIFTLHFAAVYKSEIHAYINFKKSN